MVLARFERNLMMATDRERVWGDAFFPFSLLVCRLRCTISISGFVNGVPLREREREVREAFFQHDFS